MYVSVGGGRIGEEGLLEGWVSVSRPPGSAVVIQHACIGVDFRSLSGNPPFNSAGRGGQIGRHNMSLQLLGEVYTAA